jgi:flagellar motility protein MotE (MotC chaperone)
MMRRLLPFFIVCFAILAFSKLMSLLNSESTVVETVVSHADADNPDNQNKPSPEAPDTNSSAPAKANVVDSNGNVIGEVYNIDTSQIQKIATCERLYELNFSPEEVQILQSLRVRNKDIDALSKDIDLRQKILESIKNDIEEKMVRLEKLNAQIEDVNVSQGQGSSYTKLVKIYEGMKPKEAAKIFNELQLSVMIGVAQQMKENKLAAVVAEMQPDKARDLTMALATRKDVD